MKNRIIINYEIKEMIPLFKKLLLFLILFFIILPLDLSRVAAESPPIPPSYFWGTVKVDGENVESGTIITAEIEGELVASTVVEFDDGDTVYVISVPGDESMEGDPIDFYIGGERAKQSGSWQSGTNENLNLSIFTGEYFLTFVPLVVK